MDLLIPEVISLISKLGAMMVLIRGGFMSSKITVQTEVFRFAKETE